MLNTEPNIDAPDEFYEALIDAHAGLSEAQSAALNARLILLLANEVGDLATLKEAIAAARKLVAAEHGGDRGIDRGAAGLDDVEPGADGQGVRSGDGGGHGSILPRVGGRRLTGAMKETAEELRVFVASAGVTDYLFRGETDKPHRHRTWPNAVLRKHHVEGVTPRTFRRTLATNWGDDLKSLMVQGGWSDVQTILLHYRRDVRERHLREFEKAVGPARDSDPETDLPGYG